MGSILLLAQDYLLTNMKNLIKKLEEDYEDQAINLRIDSDELLNNIIEDIENHEKIILEEIKELSNDMFDEQSKYGFDEARRQIIKLLNNK